MAVGTVDARLHKDKRGGECYDKVISGDPNISAEGRESIQSLIVWVKKLVFHLIPPSHSPCCRIVFQRLGMLIRLSTHWSANSVF